MATVRVLVSLKPSLLDSAGRTVAASLQKLEFNEVQDVRIGKVITLTIDQPDESRIRAMCDKFLANPVIEEYTYEVLA